MCESVAARACDTLPIALATSESLRIREAAWVAAFVAAAEGGVGLRDAGAVAALLIRIARFRIEARVGHLGEDVAPCLRRDRRFSKLAWLIGADQLRTADGDTESKEQQAPTLRAFHQQELSRLPNKASRRTIGVPSNTCLRWLCVRVRWRVRWRAPHAGGPTRCVRFARDSFDLACASLRSRSP